MVCSWWAAGHPATLFFLLMRRHDFYSAARKNNHGNMNFRTACGKKSCRRPRAAGQPTSGPASRPKFPIWLGFMNTLRKHGKCGKTCRRLMRKNMSPAFGPLCERNHVAALAGRPCEKEIMSPPRPAGPAKKKSCRRPGRPARRPWGGDMIFFWAKNHVVATTTLYFAMREIMSSRRHFISRCEK